MAQLTCTLYFDRADLRAYQRDVEAIVLEFGAIDLDDVQPHRRAAFKGAMDRASDTLLKCLQTEPLTSRARSSSRRAPS